MLISQQLALHLTLFVFCKSDGIISHRQVRYYLMDESFDKSCYCSLLPFNPCDRYFLNDFFSLYNFGNKRIIQNRFPASLKKGWLLCSLQLYFCTYLEVRKDEERLSQMQPDMEWDGRMCCTHMKYVMWVSKRHGRSSALPFLEKQVFLQAFAAECLDRQTNLHKQSFLHLNYMMLLAYKSFYGRRIST